MSPEQIKSLAEKLGIDPASTADDVHKKLMEHLDAENKKDKTAPITPEATALAEALKLAEDNPAVKALSELVDAQGRQLAEQAKRLRDQDIAATVKTLQESFTKKGIALAPVALDDLTKALSESNSVVLSETIVKAFAGIADAKIVKLGENGHGRNAEADASDPVVMFQAEVKKLQAEDKALTFSEAAVRIAAHNPELFDAYRSVSYAGKE